MINTDKLIDQGLVLLPLEKGTKKPIVKWRKYINYPPQKNEMRQWFRFFRDCEVGVITGKVSGIMCLDYDFHPYPENMGAYTSTPSGGRHYFFKYHEGDTHQIRVEPNLDIPIMVKLYKEPIINEGRMPINGKRNVLTYNPSQYVMDENPPTMSDMGECSFIQWFQHKRYMNWDNRYPIARAYASNVVQTSNPDKELGHNYRHEDHIYSSLQKPMTCSYIYQYFKCPYYHESTCSCSRRAGVTSPYGLAKRMQYARTNNPT